MRLFAGLTGLYIRLLRATVRFERDVQAESAALLAGDEPVIAVCWHNRLALVTAVWRRGKPVAMVQSEHGDSRLLGLAVADYITRPIYGSTRRNPLGAFRGMMRALSDGLSVGVTPDGPRGPRMRCQAGVIEAARRSGRPILPFAWSTAPRLVAGSWDRFLIPLPFTRGVILAGAPIRVPQDAEDVERWRVAVERVLTELTDEADRRVGRPAIPAAEVPGAEIPGAEIPEAKTTGVEGAR